MDYENIPMQDAEPADHIGEVNEGFENDQGQEHLNGDIPKGEEEEPKREEVPEEPIASANERAAWRGSTSNDKDISPDEETGEHPPGAFTDAVTLDFASDKLSRLALGHLRECMHFDKDGEKLRIDYILVYKDDPKKPDRAATRDRFHENLEDYDIVLYDHPNVDITDTSLHYVLLHAPWKVLLRGAELMAMKKRLKMPKTLERKLERQAAAENSCGDGCRTSQEYIPDDGEYFTAPLHQNRLDLFDITDEETFFTNAERSLIVKEVLDRTSFTPESSEEIRFGVMRLVQEGVYTSVFPLHDGPLKPIGGTICAEAFEGGDKDRALLFETWARTARCCCAQPIHLIRKYFGEKIGLYFAWLGFYTQMLIPASLIGLGAFIYGLVTMMGDPIGNDICEDVNVTKFTMCPPCNLRCDYWQLKESCIFSRVTYLFDNYATIVFTFFMAVWATCFLEFWKRKQNELQYEWDVQDFEAQERMRPEFEFKVRRRKENPVTKMPEPYLTQASWCCRTFTSLSVALFFVVMVIAATLGVIVYRFAVVTILYTEDIPFVSTWAKIITSLTASVINLIVILILGLVYKRVAFLLTEMELHRTETDFEDAYIFKMFIFQFCNYYGTTFYIAFFKGKFQAVPGSTRHYLFSQFEPAPCDPSGCMIDLLIQLFIVMVGKQALNQFKEIIIPKICVSRKQKQAKKDERDGGVYTRWMQDRDMQEVDRLMLFEEYLEMVIQYGFVTIFVAAFPLAPLFALINNVVEIRLDAYKLLTQYQRPNATKAQDIGVWYNILETMTYLSVLTNSVIIAWTSEFIPRMVYLFVYSADNTLHGYIDNSLSVYNVSDFSNITAPDKPGAQYNETLTCRYKGFYNPPDHPTDPYGYTAEFWHVVVARLAFVLVFEHACLLIVSIISYLIPDISSGVKRLMSYEKALNRHLTFKSTFEDTKEHKKHQDTMNY